MYIFLQIFKSLLWEFKIIKINKLIVNIFDKFMYRYYTRRRRDSDEDTIP
jgi:hypothetical protein